LGIFLLKIVHNFLHNLCFSLAPNIWNGMLGGTILVSTKFLQAQVGNNEAETKMNRKVNGNECSGKTTDGDSERQGIRKEVQLETESGLPGCRRSVQRENKTRETG
jgi:hypothetical protein